jgi:hypothetical protein
MFQSLNVVPAGCPIVGDLYPLDLSCFNVFRQKDDSKESSVIAYDVLKLVLSKINWENKSKTYLPQGKKTFFDWVCSGCTIDCEIRRSKIGGYPTKK